MKIVALFFTGLLLLASPALAQEENACADACPSGQKIVSFADGDDVSCRCVDEGSGMDETVPNESVGNPGESDA